ncbi:PilC/PilY family type IV pilus protein [Salinicola sp. JS01]|uniref:PilC/PilY family type IV pilus protein n=1 Tax=Salinicola sp. JS01 TaxID=3050071 RepID=UPI00255B52FF|nr:PilC/PilY family type IV pilus protein [Salinicola sp. JS01]WIX33175.1 PilC/PilY family type IV pilus protein [Salinicola sp. JS01]
MLVSSERTTCSGPGAAVLARLVLGWVMLVTLCLALPAGADDTDIYRSLYDIESRGAKPQVMILFDTSVSMRDVIVGATTESKIEIAKSVITRLVADNPQVDFGLTIFNGNYYYQPNGGRIISALPGMRGVRQRDNDSGTRRQALLDMVEKLKPVTTTPLCETYYEVFRYLSGERPWNGTMDRTNGDTNPAYSRDSVSDGSYVSPLRPCEPLYLVYMTDGEPYLDTDANARIQALLSAQASGLSCRRYPAAQSWGGEINCLPELAYYMQQLETFTQGDTPRGPVTTYTIGFNTDQRLLVDSASPLNLAPGKTCPTPRQDTYYHGKNACVGYFTATNADQLYAAFQGAIDDVLSRSTTFSAPAVSAAFTNNTQSLDRLYLPRFLPHNTPRWSGNVKRLRFASQQHWEDVRGNQAFDAQTGDILKSAYTWWSGSDGLDLDAPDGNTVEAGGVGALLRQAVGRSLAEDTGNDGRQVLTQAQGALRPLALSSQSSWLDDPANWGLPAQTSKTEIARLIAWARGVDVDDENGDGVRNQARPWILGDILHSDPIALNYGRLDDADRGDTREKLYLAFGTNAGFLHFVDGDSGQEQWAFMPRALAPLQPTLRDNQEAADDEPRHPYGVDGPAAFVRIDADRDGRITPNGDDRMLLAFGLRRGGRDYYALDVTDPAKPALAWQLSASDAFAELGQSWAAPTPARVPGHANPVFVISGGYDPGRDDPERDATQADGQGRALYIVDALTGELVYRADPSTPKHFVDGETFRQALPAAPRVVDSDNDGVADRIYLADVGGNLWRLDLAGGDPGDWRVRKIAALGGTGQDNRRFFTSVDFVGIDVDGRRQELLLLGSGDRANPKAGGEGSQAPAVHDAFFAVRDPVSVAAAEGGKIEPVSLDRLTDISDQRFCDPQADSAEAGNDGADTAARACLPAWQSGSGWVLYLDRGYSLPLTGAKVLSPSVTLDGGVYFSAYVPDKPDSICVPVVGRSYLFGIDLLTGLGIGGASGDDAELKKGARAVAAGEYLLGRPAVLVRGDELYLQGIGAASLEGLIKAGAEAAGGGMQLPYRVRRTYWYEPVP